MKGKMINIFILLLEVKPIELEIGEKRGGEEVISVREITREVCGVLRTKEYSYYS